MAKKKPIKQSTSQGPTAMQVFPGLAQINDELKKVFGSIDLMEAEVHYDRNEGLVYKVLIDVSGSPDDENYTVLKIALTGGVGAKLVQQILISRKFPYEEKIGDQPAYTFFDQLKLDL